ncbi:MAG TPA: transposase [Gemmatimonadales bacterium]
MIDGIERLRNVRSFFSYCRLVPGAKNSGGNSRHKRTKDGNRYLKLAFSHAAVRAIQYYPEIRRWYLAKRRTKGPMIARALVARELARIVYHVLEHHEPFNGTFKGRPLSRTKQSQWPRRASPSAHLEPAHGRCTFAALIGPPLFEPPTISGRAPVPQPVMVYGRRCASSAAEMLPGLPLPSGL